jgi:septal ring factor EnvC (AmiA/AmiB activator)
LQELRADLARLPSTAQQQSELQEQHLRVVNTSSPNTKLLTHHPPTQSLQDNLDTAVEEYASAAASHQSLMKRLVDLHRQRAQDIEQRAKTQLNHILAQHSQYVSTQPISIPAPRCNRGQATLAVRLAPHISMLREVLRAARTHYDQLQHTEQHHHEAAMHELSNAAAEALMTDSLALQGRAEEVQAAHATLVQGFEAAYGATARQVEALQQQDGAVRQQLAAATTQLAQLREQTATWRRKVVSHHSRAFVFPLVYYFLYVLRFFHVYIIENYSKIISSLVLPCAA